MTEDVKFKIAIVVIVLIVISLFVLILSIAMKNQQSYDFRDDGDDDVNVIFQYNPALKQFSPTITP